MGRAARCGPAGSELSRFALKYFSVVPAFAGTHRARIHVSAMKQMPPAIIKARGYGSGLGGRDDDVLCLRER